MTKQFFIELCAANDIGVIVREEYANAEQVHTRIKEINNETYPPEHYLMRWQAGAPHSDVEHFPESNR